MTGIRQLATKCPVHQENTAYRLLYNKSIIMKVEIHNIDISSTLSLQYADEGIRAGFPSPAQDYMEQAIDLNKEIVKHPASTFYGRVVGDSMSGEGIDDGDILVIDKSLELIDGDLAVCFINGEFTVTDETKKL